ncbi:hypothetical protein ACVRZD_03085 [Streptococcus hongkongensis]
MDNSQIKNTPNVTKSENQLFFDNLKKEIVLGHQDIQSGKITSLIDVREEFILD